MLACPWLRSVPYLKSAFLFFHGLTCSYRTVVSSSPMLSNNGTRSSVQVWMSEFGNSSHVIEKACIDLTPLRAGESTFSPWKVCLKISYYHTERRNDNGIMQYVCCQPEGGGTITGPLTESLWGQIRNTWFRFDVGHSQTDIHASKEVTLWL